MKGEISSLPLRYHIYALKKVCTGGTGLLVGLPIFWSNSSGDCSHTGWEVHGNMIVICAGCGHDFNAVQIEKEVEMLV